MQRLKTDIKKLHKKPEARVVKLGSCLKRLNLIKKALTYGIRHKDIINKKARVYVSMKKL